MRRAVLVGAGLALLVLHQDTWLRDDATLVFGFLPAGLAWHAGYSVACAVYWWFVAREVLPVTPERNDSA